MLLTASGHSCRQHVWSQLLGVLCICVDSSLGDAHSHSAILSGLCTTSNRGNPVADHTLSVLLVIHVGFCLYLTVLRTRTAVVVRILIPLGTMIMVSIGLDYRVLATILVMYVAVLLHFNSTLCSLLLWQASNKLFRVHVGVCSRETLLVLQQDGL